MRAAPSCTLSFLLLAASTALGQEAADPWRPETTVHLAGTHGLTGAGSMVDGRIPSPFLAQPLDGPLGATSTRFTLRYDGALRARRVWAAGRRATLEEGQQSLRATWGWTVQGIDVAVGLPYTQAGERLLIDGAPDPDRDEQGVGDLTCGLKVAFRIPNFFMQSWAVAALAPYVIGRIPTGAERVGDEAQVELGVALAGPFGFGVRYLGNAAVLHLEEGVSAFVYRFGITAVPVARSGLAARLYAHVDGAEFEGKANSTIAVAGGVQALLFDLLTLDLGASVQLFDAGRDDPGVRRAAGALGGRVTRVRHRGGLECTFGLGIVL